MYTIYFVSLVTRMYNTADKLGIPLDRFPAHITELGDWIDALRGELDQLEAEKQRSKMHLETMKRLQNYFKSIMRINPSSNKYGSLDNK